MFSRVVRGHTHRVIVCLDLQHMLQNHECMHECPHHLLPPMRTLGEEQGSLPKFWNYAKEHQHLAGMVGEGMLIWKSGPKGGVRGSFLALARALNSMEMLSVSRWGRAPVFEKSSQAPFMAGFRNELYR